MSVRIKICGLTRVDDARAAGELGIEAAGVVPASKARSKDA